ncbi:MAG: hypothetical protein ACLRMZ_16835 [Blautia marasmi]
MSKKNKKKTTFGGVLRNIILIAAVCVFLFLHTSLSIFTWSIKKEQTNTTRSGNM